MSRRPAIPAYLEGKPHFQAQVNAALAEGKTETARTVRAVKSKLNAEKRDGYDSIFEASVAGSLHALFGRERVLEQVTIPLGSKREGQRRATIRPDFVLLLDGMAPEAERLALDALFPDGVTVHRIVIVEAKGFETEAWKVREKWAAENGLRIHVLKKER